MKKNTQSILLFDLRSLAVSRICLASLLLIDIYIRIGDIEAHYSDSGILPTIEVYLHHWHPLYFSLHNINHEVWFQYVVFGFGALAATCLLIGYRPWLSSLLCWVFLISLHNRNYFILQGGDDLLRMAMFWGIFLPWDKKFTLFKPKHSTENQIDSLAGIGFMIQIASVYLFSAFMKTGPEWHKEGTALYYALNLDRVALPGGIWLRQFENILPFLTWFVYYMELIAPILFFIPFKNQWFRLIGLFLLIGFHFFSGLTLFIGLFPYIGIACLFALIPSLVWGKFKIVSHTIQEQFFPLWKKTIIAFVVLFCFAWNLGNMPQFPYRMNSTMRLPASLLRFDQSWGMFAPGVFKDDGWYIMKAITAIGDTIDINRNGNSVDYTKPPYVLEHVKNDRWRKYQEFLIMSRFSYLRENYCNYLKKSWNKAHLKTPIKTLNIIYIMELTPPPGHKPLPDSRTLCGC